MTSIDWEAMLAHADDTDSVLPRAEYNFQIVGAEHAKTQNGKDMFRLRCRVTDGPHRGRVLREQLVLSPESPMAMSIFFRHMRALGLGPDFFKGKPSAEQVVEQLMDREFIGSVGTETYNGAERNSIKNFRAAAKVPGAPSPSVAPPPPPPAPAPAAPERAPF